MDTQTVIIEVKYGRKSVKETVQIPSNETLVAAARELRQLGDSKHPAAGCYGNCIGIYIPPRDYFLTDVDLFTGKQGDTQKGGTIPEVCVFWHDSMECVADTWFKDDPPKILYFCQQIMETQLDLFDEEPICLEEGTPHRGEYTTFERNPLLRKLCLRHHGARCAICKMSFEGVYGDTAKGYIHVHHLEPLGVVAITHLVDPTNDLLPVCPNCHAVLHLKDPPYTPDQVRAMLHQENSGVYEE